MSLNQLWEMVKDREARCAAVHGIERVEYEMSDWTTTTHTYIHAHTLEVCCLNLDAKSLQSCPTLCDPIDGRPPGSCVPGILQAKNTGVGSHFLLQCMKVKSESEVTQSCPTLATPWTAAHQAPPSTGFSRQEYWNGVPLPSPIDCYYLMNIVLCSVIVSVPLRSTFPKKKWQWPIALIFWLLFLI